MTRHVVAALRKRRGLTKYGLAKLVGTNKGLIANIENGRRSIQMVDSIVKMALALDVPPADLFVMILRADVAGSEQQGVFIRHNLGHLLEERS